MEHAIQQHDRRRVPRARALLAARIVFDRGSATLECTIRNISEGGAKLVLNGAVTVPAEFDLVIPHKGVTRRARIIWRRGDEIGVAFLRPPAPLGTEIGEAPLRRRVGELEAEIARLQARIGELTRE